MTNVPAAEPPVQEMPHTCAFTTHTGQLCGQVAEYRMPGKQQTYLCQSHYVLVLDVLRAKTLRSWFEE